MLTASWKLEALNDVLTNKNGGDVMFCCYSVAREEEMQTFLSNGGKKKKKNRKHTLVWYENRFLIQ